MSDWDIILPVGLVAGFLLMSGGSSGSPNYDFPDDEEQMMPQQGAHKEEAAQYEAARDRDSKTYRWSKTMERAKAEPQSGQALIKVFKEGLGQVYTGIQELSNARKKAQREGTKDAGTILQAEYENFTNQFEVGVSEQYMIRRIGDEINKTLEVVTASMKDTTWSFNAREPIPISVREKLLLALGDLKVEANRTRQLVNSEQATTMKLLRTLDGELPIPFSEVDLLLSY